MIIKGFQATTLLDYPGNIASLVFTAGCNFRCGYCYNKSLVDNSKDLQELDPDKIIKLIESRKKLMDGVVISGGEPLMYKDLPDFIKKIKDLGLKVKIDTNGTFPDMLKSLIDNKLVNFIAMDIKSSLNKYNEATCVKVDIEKIKESAKLIMNSNVDYEFRTTTLPKLITKNDFIEIGKWLSGAKKYCIQQFAPMEGMIDESYMDEKSYTKEDLEEIRDSIKDYFEKIELRV